MNFGQDSSPMWPYDYDAQPEQPASLYYQLHHEDETDMDNYGNAGALGVYETHPGYNPGWNLSPSASPASSSTSSGSEEPPPFGSATLMSSFLSHDNSVDRSRRSPSASSPGHLHPYFSHPYLPEPDPPIIHKTFEVNTGEDAVINALIHRLTDEEKRSLSFTSLASRPAFCCNFRGCGKWLFHRAQIKPHLSEHGYRFCKPYKCACGAEFGRQVEATRHVDDKKLCETCHRSGRKYKGSAICLRCLRRLGRGA